MTSRSTNSATAPASTQRSTSTQHIADRTAESRWPDWTIRACKAGAHSSLSIGLPVQEAVPGALNICADKPDAFDEDAVAVAVASYAEVAMANVYVYNARTTLAQHVEIAMRSRAVIEQAKGIIMGDRRCSADEAFTVLAKLSRDSARQLRDVAWSSSDAPPLRALSSHNSESPTSGAIIARCRTPRSDQSS